MGRVFTRAALFLAFLVILMGTAMWILNGAEVGGLASLAEEAMKSTGWDLGETLANI